MHTHAVMIYSNMLITITLNHLLIYILLILGECTYIKFDRKP